MTTELDLKGETINVRDIIARYEELESAEDGLPNAEERTQLAAILDELKNSSGDEQWRDGWYPSVLINEYSFEEYTRDMLEDCGTIPKDFPTWIEIDWEATAQNVQSDYDSININGNTYWYR